MPSLIICFNYVLFKNRCDGLQKHETLLKDTPPRIEDDGTLKLARRKWYAFHFATVDEVRSTAGWVALIHYQQIILESTKSS